MTKRIPPDHVKLKRAYEPVSADDGTRILIDRLWPRGVKTADAAIDQWIKDVAPSTSLRKWFGHDPERLGGVSPPVRRGGPPASRTAYYVTNAGKTGPDHSRVLSSRRTP